MVSENENIKNSKIIGYLKLATAHFESCHSMAWKKLKIFSIHTITLSETIFLSWYQMGILYNTQEKNYSTQKKNRCTQYKKTHKLLKKILKTLKHTKI